MSIEYKVITLFHKAEPLFIALGDVSRQQIVVQLLQAPKLSVNQIADATPLSRPAISHHLKILKQAGIVDVERAGTQRLYYLGDGANVQVELLETLAKALRECTAWQDVKDK